MEVRKVITGPSIDRFNHAPVALVWVHGNRHIVDYTNPAFEALWRKTAASLIGLPITPPRTEDTQFLAMLDQAGTSGESVTGSCLHPSKPDTHHLHLDAWPCRDADGTPGIAMQVTEVELSPWQLVAVNEALVLGAIRQNELAEAAELLNSRLQSEIDVKTLAESILASDELLFATLIQQAPLGVYVVDGSLHLQQANPKALSAFESVQPLIGRAAAEIFSTVWPKKEANRILARFRHTLATGKSYRSSDFTARRKDTRQKEIYDWQLERITLPDGGYGVVCFFEEITPRKQAESIKLRLEVVTASNAKLVSQIGRREAVEASLKAAQAAQSKLLMQSLLQQEELRNLSHQIIHAQEEERKRISRELHDVIVQTLIGINVQVAALSQAAAIPSNLPAEIERTRGLVEKSAEIIHRFARDLRPSMLDDLGLIPALRSYLKDFSARTGIPVKLTAYKGVEALGSLERTTLYRVAQEALTNAARHAKATEIKVRIRKLKNCIVMEISDNGIGFDPDVASTKHSKNRLGLIGMRERLEMVGGKFRVISSPGQPTTVRVEISHAANPSKP